MATLFRKPQVQQMPAPVAPPAPPSVDTAAAAQGDADALLARKRRGRASTMLSGDKGFGAPQTSAKVLLGQ